MRFVIDTNILVSFLFWKQSAVYKTVEGIMRNGEVLRSTDSFAELAQVVLRPKFDPYLTRAERELFLASFYDQTHYVLVDERITGCRDPKDNKFLELALAGKAGMLLSGDSDLLVLDPFRNIRIVNPATFALKQT